MRCYPDDSSADLELISLSAGHIPFAVWVVGMDMAMTKGRVMGCVHVSPLSEFKPSPYSHIREPRKRANQEADDGDRNRISLKQKRRLGVLVLG